MRVLTEVVHVPDRRGESGPRERLCSLFELQGRRGDPRDLGQDPSRRQRRERRLSRRHLRRGRGDRGHGRGWRYRDRGGRRHRGLPGAGDPVRRLPAEDQGIRGTAGERHDGDAGRRGTGDDRGRASPRRLRHDPLGPHLMDARGIIWKLRQRENLTEAEIRWFAAGLAAGEVSDAQAGAFAMAACLNGLSTRERVALTLAMRDSGDVLSWTLPGPVVDKHSTGGLGDCVSLLLAPMLACAGVYNPMISGRGLGHTGGTLDKMEAIPGVATEVSENRFREIVADVGCAIVSATGNLAPADRRLYAIRDVTSTVESIDLITASILSKKLAAGLGALVLDVKAGSGAFMTTMEEARALARSLVDTANGAGCRTVALISDMNQPLAASVGNAVEVADCLEVLTGDADGGALAELTIELVAELLVMAGVQDGLDAARRAASDSLSSGAAAERFGRMVAALGGPSGFVEDWRTHLPGAAVRVDVVAPRAGTVSGVDGRALGEAVVHLGGGRLRGGDPVDPAVGLSGLAAIGDRIEAGAPLATVHAADEAASESAVGAVLGAYRLGDGPVAPPALIRERIT